MTGTPIENHLGELWSLFEFLNPGMLGQSTAFHGADQERPQRRATTPAAAGQGPAARSSCAAPRSRCSRELPEKTEQTLYCEMEPKQRKLYDELRDYYRASLSQQVEEMGLATAKIHVLEALLRLRQAACHPGLIDKQARRRAQRQARTAAGADSTKCSPKATRPWSSRSSPACWRSSASGWTSRRSSTSTWTARRATASSGSTRFQNDPDCPLFLISLKAGGHGLNLTAADYVFILDPWWNPAVEAQAIDRTHRIGQTRRVFAYRLICRDTVEDKILELQQTKRDWPTPSSRPTTA